MKFQFLIVLFVLGTCFSWSQSDLPPLFDQQSTLKLKMSFSFKDLKKNTNDSTYINTSFTYLEADGNWIEMEGRIRARGNFRLENCYFPPVKLKIKKKEAKGTVFKGSRSLKLVLPCLRQTDNNDNVRKEYMAYKIYEAVSPYHFKTRLVELELTEVRKGDDRIHRLTAFLIEDVDKMAERYGGKELERSIHPLEQDNICSTRNDFFQYMIGNTDFSVAYQHNEKLIYANDMIIPVPYDFDMSGMVNASYGLVSVIGDEELPITKVTDRLYRGFRRTDECYEEIRSDYLARHVEVMKVCSSYSTLFDDAGEYKESVDYLDEFFALLSDDDRYERQILAKARDK